MVRENLERRIEVLKYLARRTAGGEGPPSVREVGEAVGLRSSQTAYKYLKKLEEDGFVERQGSRQARGVRLTEKGWEAAGEMPLLGWIAAGRGLEAIAVGDEAYSLAAELLGSRSGRPRYLLRVVGQSMIGAHIADGDLLVVEAEEDEGWTGKILPASDDAEFESLVKRFEPEDILFGKLRPYLAKVARPSRRGVCVGEFFVLRETVGAVRPEFLERLLRTAPFIHLVNSSTFGAKMPRGCYELDQKRLGNAESGEPREIGPTGESAFQCGFHPSS